MMVETHTVEDENGIEKQMLGWPTNLRDHWIPTGESDLDWRCPSCGEVGHYRRRGKDTIRCTNMDCRTRGYSPFVDGVDDE